jgi:hypothetical protein
LRFENIFGDGAFSGGVKEFIGERFNRVMGVMNGELNGR